MKVESADNNIIDAEEDGKENTVTVETAASKKTESEVEAAIEWDKTN